MNLNWMNAELIINICEAVLCFSFMNLYLEKKKENKLFVYVIIIIQSIIGQLLNIYLGPGSFISLLVLIFMNFLIYNFIFKGSKVKIIFLILCYGIIVIFAHNITIAFFNFVLKIQIKSVTSWGSTRFMLGIISRLLIYIVLMYMKQYKIFKNNIKLIFLYELITLISINIIYAFITYDIYEHYHPSEDSNLFGILTLGIVIFTIFVMKIIEELAKYSQKELQWNIRQKEYEHQLEYIKNMEKLTYRMKAQRHDFNQHMSCLYGLLDVERYEEAKAYISTLIKDVKEINYIAAIDNPLVAAIVNFKLSIAKEKGIEIICNVSVPTKLPIDDVDLCILLGNTLDNAIEACEKVTEKKYIVLDIYTKGSYFLIKVINSKLEKINKIEEEILSSKEDKDNHGFGLQNIKYVLAKYDGLFNIEDSLEKFELKMAIQTSDINNSF